MEMKNDYKILAGNWKEISQLGELGLDGRIILK
jgi:hypothetical protein